MKDGHTGTRTVEIKKDALSHNFIVGLTRLQENSTAWCVLHVHSRVTRLTHGLAPADFLSMLGFQRYEGQCPVLNRTCHYKYVRQHRRAGRR